MLPIAIRRHGAWYDPISLIEHELRRSVKRVMQKTSQMASAYPVDVFEDDVSVIVEAELPGFKKEDIHITLEKNSIKIEATRTPQTSGRVIQCERRANEFSRWVPLGVTVDVNAADAHYENGVLQVRIPKTGEEIHRRIEVRGPGE